MELNSEILCFVGRLPKRKISRFLRSTIGEALVQYGFLTVQFADGEAPADFERIRSHIDRAAFCIFDVSGVRRSDAVLELGYALGQGKPSVLLLRRGDRCPAALDSREKLTYSSARQLKDALQQVKIYPYVFSFLGAQDSGLQVAVSRDLLARGSLDPAVIFEIAANRRCSEQQVHFALSHLRALGMATVEGIDWHVTPAGQQCLSRLIQEIGSQDTRVVGTAPPVVNIPV